jgi:Hint module
MQPSKAPTPKPTAKPTAKPTPRPTIFPGIPPAVPPVSVPDVIDIIGNLTEECFSEDNVVYVQHKGDVALRDLQVGDDVLAADQNYQPIYAFGHNQNNQIPTTFLVFHTNQSSLPALELTPMHMLYLFDDPNQPVLARDVQVGDILIHRPGTGNSSAEPLPVEVTSIDSVMKSGALLPLTVDGTVVVNGIQASVYSSVPHAQELFSWLAPMWTHQTIFHWFLTPLRMICSSELTRRYTGVCEAYTEDGLLVWLDFGNRLAKYLNQLSFVWQVISVAIGLSILGTMRLVEVMMGPTLECFLLFTVLPGFLIWKLFYATKDDEEEGEDSTTK